MTPQKADYAQKVDKRTLDDVIDGADLFLGLSGPGVLTPEMVARMAKRPIVFALANPTPEIPPDEVRVGRARCDHGHRAAAIFPIRSITCCVFPSFFAVRWMWGPPRSMMR